MSDPEGQGDRSTPTRPRWKRILGPVAFLLALGVLAQETCQAERAEATLIVRTGATRVELELLAAEGTERLGFFRGSPVDGAVRWTLSADPGDYDLAVTLHHADRVDSLRRRVTIRDRATLEIEP